MRACVRVCVPVTSDLHGVCGMVWYRTSRVKHNFKPQNRDKHSLLREHALGCLTTCAHCCKAVVFRTEVFQLSYLFASGTKEILKPQETYIFFSEFGKDSSVNERGIEVFLQRPQWCIHKDFFLRGDAQINIRLQTTQHEWCQNLWH